MPKKITLDISTDELKELYHNQNFTLKQLCNLLGVKSPITMSKILKEHGISTNKNQLHALPNRLNMSEKEFSAYLRSEYSTKSCNMIAEELGVSVTIIYRYLDKYKISRLNQADSCLKYSSGKCSSTWKGGKRLKNGYIEIKCPEHPRSGQRGYVYEHILIMEKHLGRYLKPDEVVHHKNYNKTDNRIENLQLMTIIEHNRFHTKDRVAGIQKGR